MLSPLSVAQPQSAKKAPAVAQKSAPPPNGVYRCSSATMPGFPHMGYLEIRGTTYRFSPGNQPTGSFAACYLIPGDKREWRSPLGEVGKGGRPIVESGIERGNSYVSVWGKSPSGPNGLAETVSCRFEIPR